MKNKMIENEKENLMEKKENEESVKTETFQKSKKKKHLIIPVVLVFLVALSLLLYHFFTSNADYKGEMESLIVPAVSEVSGKIIESNIMLGQTVRQGDVLAVIDSTNQVYEISQLELALQKKKIALGDLSIGQGGQASNAYLSAQANYNSVTIAADKASKDYANAKALYDAGAISSSELEKAQVAAALASSQKSAALAQLNNTLNESGLSSSQLDVAILENQLAQAKDNLSNYTLTAACDGIIISKNYGAGSVVSPGFNIADIGSADELYVVFYVPEDKVTQLNYQDTVKIKSDGKQYTGKISYIDIKSQYTPKDQQTEANKSKTSFKVKALVPDNSGLKPGMEVLITLN